MQWRIQGRGLGGPGTPIVAEKKFFRDRPTHLSQGLDDRPSFPPPPPSYLKFLIRNFYARLASSIEQIEIAHVNFGFHEINM